MGEQLKKHLVSLKGFWTNSSKKTKRTILCAGALVLALAVGLSVFMNLTKYKILYPRLDSEEAVAVMKELDERGVPYKEKSGTIYVPEEKENAVRMELANEGYPTSAPNYDFFTQNIDLMTTDYEKKIIEKYQMNQRLEAVIETFDAVKKASVTINLAEASGYVWDEEEQDSSVAVALTLYSGKSLDSTQVGGIKQLISKSLPRLDPENVAVIDTATSKELLSSGGGVSTAVEISDFKRTVEREYENDIEKSIYSVLESLYGRQNVRVIAKSVMDVDKKVKEVVTYLPSENNKGVVTKEETVTEQERNGGGTQGVAGEENNTEPGYTGVTTDGDTLYLKDQKSYDYLVSQVKESIQSDAASVKDMTVAVVVNQAALGAQEKEEVGKLVAYAAAIPSEKVAVYAQSFFEDDPAPVDVPPGPFKNWMLYAAAGGGILLILLTAILILAASLRRSKRAVYAGYGAEEEVPAHILDNLSTRVGGGSSEWMEQNKKLAEELRQMEEMRAMQQSSDEQVKRSLQDFSTQNPEIVAQLIKSWIRGEDADV